MSLALSWHSEAMLTLQDEQVGRAHERALAKGDGAYEPADREMEAETSQFICCRSEDPCLRAPADPHVGVVMPWEPGTGRGSCLHCLLFLFHPQVQLEGHDSSLLVQNTPCVMTFSKIS